jgi:hypothetical protein
MADDKKVAGEEPVVVTKVKDKKGKEVPITSDQIDSISVSMSQKMTTLQAYEVRDFFTAVSMKFIPGQDPRKVMEYGRKLCSAEIGAYYNALKDSIQVAKNKESQI